MYSNSLKLQVKSDATKRNFPQKVVSRIAPPTSPTVKVKINTIVSVYARVVSSAIVVVSREPC
jgi:hypothetical protein